MRLLLLLFAFCGTTVALVPGLNWISIPIDHFGGNPSSTYKNRFWVNDTYYRPGGPVFIFDAGEQDAAPLHPYYLQEYHGLSATVRLAERYGGIALLWEHRYYGESLPFPLNENTTGQEWQYLTTEQALEDVVFFANSFGSSSQLHPSNVPWIWLGASYPGTRGAMLRLKHPDIIFAAWASSAPPQAQIYMPSYYQTIERSMTRNCSADWVAITRHLDDILSQSDETLRMETKFKLLKALYNKSNRTITREMAAQLSNVETGRILTQPLGNFQYFGFGSILPFCDLFVTNNLTIAPPPAGIAALKGPGAAFEAFIVALSETNNQLQRGPPLPESWVWQYCSEYGFYMVGDPDDDRRILTKFRTVEWYQEMCHASFPTGSLPEKPEVGKILKFGGWNMNPTNVFFTNGELDPWRTLSLSSVEPSAPHRRPSSTIPSCNVPPAPSTFFGLTHVGMVHSPDMRVLLTEDANHTDFNTIGYHSPISPEPYYRASKLFQQALDIWLPCFRPTTMLPPTLQVPLGAAYMASLPVHVQNCPL